MSNNQSCCFIILISVNKPYSNYYIYHFIVFILLLWSTLYLCFERCFTIAYDFSILSKHWNVILNSLTGSLKTFSLCREITTDAWNTANHRPPVTCWATPINHPPSLHLDTSIPAPTQHWMFNDGAFRCCLVNSSLVSQKPGPNRWYMWFDRMFTDQSSRKS